MHDHPGLIARNYKLLDGETRRVQSPRPRTTKRHAIRRRSNTVLCGCCQISVRRSNAPEQCSGAGVVPIVGRMITLGTFARIRVRQIRRGHILDMGPISSSFSLYLRCFDDDTTVEINSGTNVLTRGALASVTPQTTEEAIVQVFCLSGPVVAIGRPSDVAPIRGSCRIYVWDDNWQRVVHDLAVRASAVILRAGHSDGLRWKVRDVVNHVKPERLCIVMVQRSGYLKERTEGYDKRKAAVEKWSGPALPPASSSKSVIVRRESGEFSWLSSTDSHPLAASVASPDNDSTLMPATTCGPRSEKITKSILIRLAITSVWIVILRAPFRGGPIVPGDRMWLLPLGFSPPHRHLRAPSVVCLVTGGSVACASNERRRGHGINQHAASVLRRKFVHKSRRQHVRKRLRKRTENSKRSIGSGHEAILCTFHG